MVVQANIIQDRLQELFPVNYRNGNILMINADCMEVMKHIHDNEVELSCVDPPYGIGMDGGNVGYKGFNDFEKKDWDALPPPKEYFDELFRVSKNQIIWGGNNFNLPARRGFIVWDKGAGFKNRTYAECELAWLSIDANAAIFNHDPLAKGDYRGKIHPTQKPVALYKWLLSRYAKPGDRILDTHGGSGSICIACHDLGFDLTWMELDTDYYNAAVKRYKNHAAQGFLIDPKEA
jgi:site-specific DNA-methyltransferase (adenine-specific)